MEYHELHPFHLALAHQGVTDCVATVMVPLLQSEHSSAPLHPPHSLGDIIISMKNGEPVEVMKLLEIFNNCAETDMQVKLLTILSGYLMLNGDTIEAIATYRPLYDKLYKILVNCPPRRATVAFNFLSALLYGDFADNQRRSSILIYARNLIRSSGCLAAICDLFTSCMMDQEAWRALCRCLAESCHGTEGNQSYCTHLVPICIKRCNQRNVELLLVLQSLLQNHSRNIALFVECNGMTLFQREFLQHDMCLQLLATIVQSSSEAATFIVNTDICQQLRDFLQRYGPQSPMGQWSTIILYHTSRVEVSLTTKKIDGDKENNKLSESFLKKLSQNRKTESSVDTTIFFRNVMQEIMLCGAQTEHNFKPFLSTNGIIKGRESPMDTSRAPFCEIFKERKDCYCAPVYKIMIKMNYPYLFYVTKIISQTRTSNNIVTPNRYPETTQRTLQTNVSTLRHNTVYDSLIKHNLTLSYTQEIDAFNPQFMSTPKKEFQQGSRYQKQNDHSTYSSRSATNHQVKRQAKKKRVTRHFNQTKTDIEMKHKSFSGRFFDAINTSCTTLVKTVKNIFRPKKYLQEPKDDSLNRTNRNASCSYSFTNYMRRRDAVAKDEDTSKVEGLMITKEHFGDFSTDLNNSCKTCNDTITLKRKLRNDDHLKKTLRKLKLGINLYGCDFKKISRSMWPKERYMTPVVLYNLYRKLILK
ncbi:hypothetical protein HW555_007086 [Spodoptera exigua]|uniref:Uncharacterized protein n=1 Tax=Spodoptera exigua TaxID=7107 RepID=A0A835GFF8_SPOEX|nr:hypothetical protein HW555_007086 [Spodoptera exigua]